MGFLVLHMYTAVPFTVVRGSLLSTKQHTRPWITEVTWCFLCKSKHYIDSNKCPTTFPMPNHLSRKGDDSNKFNFYGNVAMSFCCGLF